MTAKITFFPVSNGDMTLLKLDNDQVILTDINIRNLADDTNSSVPDVAEMLRERLEKRGRQNGYLYVDAFCLSHPDKDHITGLKEHFHLGPPEEWSEKDDKIIIKEMWSSPVIFRQASKNNTLCEDARAWNKEAKRRVKLYRDTRTASSGNNILILGEDEEGKTDDIQEIVVKINEEISKSNQIGGNLFNARLLGPLTADVDEEKEDLIKNRSSIILRYSIHADDKKENCLFLTGGDSEVEIWKRLWNQHKFFNRNWLEYDLLQAPHHCSWRSLSFDSLSEKGDRAVVDQDAISALSQCCDGAVIVSSSKVIKNDDENPPSYRAKKEYVKIVGNNENRFYCTDEEWDSKGQPIEFEISYGGVKRGGLLAATAAPSLLGTGAISTEKRPHGK